MRGRRTLLSVKELAAELGVSVDSIRRAFWNGRIPAFRICKILRFDLDQVRNAFQVGGLAAAVQAGAVRVRRSAIGGASRRRAKRTSPRLGKTGASIARTPRRKK